MPNERTCGGPLEQASEINARLERLERENRRMKKIGIVAVVFASVLFISGQAKTNKVVEANEFVLKDGNGKARARLSMFTLSENTLMQKDIPNLSFYDAEGHPRIFIAAESPIYLVIPRRLVGQTRGTTNGKDGQTPAASLVLFGKDKNLLGSAP